MSSELWSCVSSSQRVVDLLMALVCLTLAVGFAVLARRHFLAGRGARGWISVTGALASAAIAELWVICTVVGIPPFFMGGPGTCDRSGPEREIMLRRLESGRHPGGSPGHTALGQHPF